MPRKLILIWALLLIFTGIEVLLAVPNMAAAALLIILLALSIGKSALIVSWFMHLKYSPRSLSWMLLPILGAFIVALLAFLPDAERILVSR